ncbi:hypothetical protein [Achromobacter sp.]|uniref:hypothetical protein n=1 Tax=Achromobacter sp. TaxID=134375 RepID=UPI002F9288D8
MIILETDHPERLWARIQKAVSERRFEGWEAHSDVHLAQMDWPTRYANLRLRAGYVRDSCELRLHDLSGDRRLPAQELFTYQKSLGAQLCNMFAAHIKNARISVRVQNKGGGRRKRRFAAEFEPQRFEHCINGNDLAEYRFQ